MATDFDLAFDEFSGELDALSEMAIGSGSSSATALSPRARIAAGNGAMLLLAAIFEEHIRQQVRSAFQVKSRMAADLSQFPDKIASVVWKRSLESLARKPFDEIEADTRAVDNIISSTLSFCLRKRSDADVSDRIAHNENNMRPAELNRLFNQIGFKNVVGAACERPDLIAFLGCDGAGKANLEFVARLDDFFRRRNEVAHAIQIGSSSGPSELIRDIDLFRLFARSLAEAINDLISPAPVALPPPLVRRSPRRSSPQTSGESSQPN
ncbi:MAG: HEPN domain-containing protein [Pseudomonadota bacterium]